MRPRSRVMANTTRKTKNRIFAMPAAPAATPPKPKMAAMMAMTAKTADHLSMGTSSTKEWRKRHYPVRRSARCVRHREVSTEGPVRTRPRRLNLALDGRVVRGGDLEDAVPLVLPVAAAQGLGDGAAIDQGGLH